MVMAALAMPAVADEVDDLILDLNGTDVNAGLKLSSYGGIKLSIYR